MSTTIDEAGHIIRKGPYPELTVTAVLVGYFLGALIALSIGYAALILGFSIEGSELAAILGFGILRGLLNRSSIVENNVVQTVASAVNGASSGMMFSVPAIFILGYDQTHFNPELMVFGCIAGAFLGIAFIIPLRKQMIDYERLTYPGGVAVATILKSPGAGIQKAVLLLSAALISGIAHYISKDIGFENWAMGAAFNLPEYLNITWYVSLLTVGVAFIAGKGGIAFIIGGYVCYWFIAPLLSGFDLLPMQNSIAVTESNTLRLGLYSPVGIGLLDPCSWSYQNGVTVTDPNTLRLSLYRPVGIGMLIGGALMGIILAFPLIVGAVRSMQNAAKVKSAISQDEMPIKLLYVAILGSAIVLAVIAVLSTQEMGWMRGIFMAVIGTLWIWIAGVILSECIGRTNWSPLSGMTLIAITILIIISSGLGDTASVIASVMVGAAACVAMSQATDLMLDLKTGYLVGATPKMQMMGQFLGAWLGPLLIMALIILLHQAYELGSDQLPAPQGQALASMITGIQGGEIPLSKYIAGAGMGALLGAASGGLGITVGLGFYLPFNIVLTYSLGTFLRLIVDKKVGHQFSEEVGIPVAAGLIVGEALVGVGFAVYYVIQGAT